MGRDWDGNYVAAHPGPCRSERCAARANIPHLSIASAVRARALRPAVSSTVSIICVFYLVLLNALSSVPSAPRFSSARSRCLRPPHCTACLAAPAASLCSCYGHEGPFAVTVSGINPLRVLSNLYWGWEGETATHPLERRLVIF